ncbi:MAG: ATP-binding protein [Polyangiaceae bacterium]
MRLGFRSKLLASYLVLVVVVVAVAVVDLNRSLGADLLRQLDDRLEQQAIGAAQWVSSGRRHTDRLAGRLAAIVGTQVTIVDQSGAVIGDAAPDGSTPDETGNQGEQPEVAAARAGKTGRATRRSPGSGEEMTYVAVPAGDDLVVRLGQPLSGIQATVRSMRQRLFFAAALAAAAALALALVASRVAAAPLRAMTRSAERIAEGDYQIAVASDSPDELGALSRALASLAGQLEGRIGDLTAERDRLSAILAGMAEGVLVTRGDGQVIVANPAAAAILRQDGALVGRTIAEAVPEPWVRDVLDGAARGGETREAEGPAGGDRHLAVYVRPLAQGAGGGTVAVLRDMPQLRRFETMRRDFVANVSHELRTPVTAIQGYAETVLRGTADAATTRRFLETIHRHAQRVGRLLEDLLRLSSLEAMDAQEAVREPVPLRAVADQVAQTALLRRRTPDADIRVEIPTDAVALGDPASVEQVLENLVDNALKYGRAGGTVRIGGQRRADRLEISVADDGPGLEPRHLSRIFERFYRADPGRSREMGGTGLGLAIVKHLVEAMGGRVAVESELGHGCRFVVELPAAPAARATSSSPPVAAAGR